MSRSVTVRPGKRWGWWIDGRKGSGGRFMLWWWPTEGFARTVARWFGGEPS